MRWATVFLPQIITVFTSRETNVLLNFASFRTGRLVACRRRDMISWLQKLPGYLIYKAACLGRGGLGWCCRGGSGGLGAGFRAFHPVFRAADSALLHAGGVERPAHDMVTHPGQIFHAAA